MLVVIDDNHSFQPDPEKAARDEVAEKQILHTKDNV